MENLKNSLYDDIVKDFSASRGNPEIHISNLSDRLRRMNPTQRDKYISRYSVDRFSDEEKRSIIIFFRRIKGHKNIPAPYPSVSFSDEQILSSIESQIKKMLNEARCALLTLEEDD